MGKRRTAADHVRKWTKAGKVKKKCCRSTSRCGKCPVLALKRAKAKVARRELGHASGAGADLLRILGNMRNVTVMWWAA